MSLSFLSFLVLISNGIKYLMKKCLSHRSFLKSKANDECTEAVFDKFFYVEGPRSSWNPGLFGVLFFVVFIRFWVFCGLFDSQMISLKNL